MFLSNLRHPTFTTTVGVAVICLLALGANAMSQTSVGPKMADSNPNAPASACGSAPVRVGRTQYNWPGDAESSAKFQQTEEAYNRAYKAGVAAFRAKDYLAAEASFREAIAVDPNGLPYLGLAEAFAAQGRTDEALQTYWTLFHPGPERSWGGSYWPRAQLGYALLLNQTGRWSEAVALYEAALPSLPDAKELKSQPRFDPAVPQPARLAAATHIGLGLDGNWLGDGLANNDDERAFQEYARACQMEPNWAVASYFLAYGWRRLTPKEQESSGLVRQAKSALLKAIQPGPFHFPH